MGISSRMGRNQQNVLVLPEKFGLGTRNSEGMWGLQLQNSHHLSLDRPRYTSIHRPISRQMHTLSLEVAALC